MAGSGEHIKALVRSHASGDEDSFYAVASQIAARAARQGHNRLASDLKRTIDASRRAPVATKGSVTSLAQPRGDLADLVTASYPSVGLRDLVGPSPLLGQVHRVIAEQRQRHRLQERGFAPAHRLLLEGPPGTGKTLTASVLAHELSLPLLTVRLESLLSKFLGETASKLRTVFDAVESQRAVYLFDEFDALGGDRSGNDVGEARRILNSFLVFLENTGPESLVVAATNHRAILDRALFRRFDLVITYGLPDHEHATAVMQARLGPLAKHVDWQLVIELVDGLSHAELVQAAETAAKQALMRDDEHVTAADLVDALRVRQTASRA
ncbi:ATP-binding protein [Patulibacter brassicae]|jgi:SpoVK/Ycf46/Vps4 family AAA+-type ATPase|uniref:ATP-binding protein n=1 Tax=Patulibacter brassicae TaxID=1705717 RepID=A0ABU4VR12_9ACTN|nr:ATP-binding protein [Patulibacter brassicae]MDX8153318.1 ATP-binding protein [Patulibacter brassicae]